MSLKVLLVEVLGERVVNPSQPLKENNKTRMCLRSMQTQFGIPLISVILHQTPRNEKTTGTLVTTWSENKLAHSSGKLYIYIYIYHAPC